MPTTPVYQLPYPAATDPADVPTDMQELADRVEALSFVRAQDTRKMMLAGGRSVRTFGADGKSPAFWSDLVPGVTVTSVISVVASNAHAPDAGVVIGIALTPPPDSGGVNFAAFLSSSGAAFAGSLTITWVALLVTT